MWYLPLVGSKDGLVRMRYVADLGQGRVQFLASRMKIPEGKGRIARWSRLWFRSVLGSSRHVLALTHGTGFC